MNTALEQRRDQLIEQAKGVALEREVRALESAIGLDTYLQRMMEAAGFSAAGNYMITPQQIQREIGWGPLNFGPQLSQADDYLGGQCKPFYENEGNLQEIRGLGRWLAGSDEMANCVLGNLRNYTIADGFKVNVTAKKGSGAEAQALEVQAFVDEFLDANAFTDEGESDALIQSVIDGDHLLWLQSKGPTAPRVRYVGAEHITEPDQPREIEDHWGFYSLCWRFGVATDVNDAEQVHGYFVDWFGQGTDWDFIPEGESVFYKRNVPRACKRGISDFFIPFKRLDRGSKLFDSTVLGATIQSSIAYIKEHATGTPQSSLEAAALNNRLTQQVDVVTASGSRESVTGENILGGKVLNVAGTKYHAAPMGSPQGPLYMEIYQAVTRRVGSRWEMPEYMISGDASNANYASTLVAESPFIQQIKCEQTRHARKEKELLWKAIDMVAKCGRFGGMTAQELYAIVEIKVEPPSPESRDPVKQEEVYDAQQAAGILSAKSRATKSGLDYEQEVTDGAKEKVEPSPFGGLGHGFGQPHDPSMQPAPHAQPDLPQQQYEARTASLAIHAMDYLLEHAGQNASLT